MFDIHSTTCCIQLYDLCIKYAQWLCADGLIRLARKGCFFCLSFHESYISLEQAVKKRHVVGDNATFSQFI